MRVLMAIIFILSLVSCNQGGGGANSKKPDEKPTPSNNGGGIDTPVSVSCIEKPNYDKIKISLEQLIAQSRYPGPSPEFEIGMIFSKISADWPVSIVNHVMSEKRYYEIMDLAEQKLSVNAYLEALCAAKVL